MICRLIRFQALFASCLFILAALIWHEEIDAASLQLTWADNSQNEDGFDIERKGYHRRVFSAQPWVLIKGHIPTQSFKRHNLLLSSTGL